MTSQGQVLPRGPAQSPRPLFFCNLFLLLLLLPVAFGPIWLLEEKRQEDLALLPAKVATVRSDHCWQRSACSTSCCTSRGKRRRQEMLFQSSDHRRTGLNCFVLGLRFLFEFLLFFCRQASAVVRGIGILFIPARLLTLQGRGSSTQGCRFERKHAGFGFLQFSFSFLFLLYFRPCGSAVPFPPPASDIPQTH